jgi:hypothetical protein
MQTFEVGKTYFGRFISNYDSVFKYTVTKRTDKTVWLKSAHGDDVKCRIKTWHDGHAEYVLPMGSYSMAPMLCADRPIEKLKD